VLSIVCDRWTALVIFKNGGAHMKCCVTLGLSRSNDKALYKSTFIFTFTSVREEDNSEVAVCARPLCEI